MGNLAIDFTQAPTVFDAVMSDAFVTGLLGPVGSGKSTGGAAWLMKVAHEQAPAEKDNIRYTRIGVVRNTAPELKTTTIKTVTDTLPEGQHGRVVYSSPINYHIKIKPNKRTGEPGIDCEILFVPLDTPKDVRKLLSLELTAAWINEAREVSVAIVDALTGRVGRYPSKDKGRCTKRGMFMDTNPPDEDHWWPDYFEKGAPVQKVVIDGVEYLFDWKLFRQPPALLEVERRDNQFFSIEKGHDFWEFAPHEVIDQVNKLWAVNPEAENLANLVPGYYHQQISKKRLDYIRAFLQGKYTMVIDGKAVVSDYNDEVHVMPIPILSNVPFRVGTDIGGGTLNPCSIIAQYHPRGVWLIQDEFIGTDIGVENFIHAFKLHLLSEDYLKKDGEIVKVSEVWVDPVAETGKDELFEVKIMEYIKGEGFRCRAAPTNDIKSRVEAVNRPFTRMVDGKPGIIIHPRCKRLRKALAGGWKFKRLQVSGQERYQDKPDKTHPFSDLGDALTYLLMGGGEHKIKNAMTPEEQNKTALQEKYGANNDEDRTDFDVFG